MDNPQPSKPDFWIVGHRLYAQCRDCGSIVRINKPILGSLHLCVETPTQSLQPGTRATTADGTSYVWIAEANPIQDRP